MFVIRNMRMFMTVVYAFTILMIMLSLTASSSGKTSEINENDSATKLNKENMTDTEPLLYLEYYTYLNSYSAKSLRNLSEHEAYKKKKEITGVDVKFIHIPNDDSFQWMMASDQLPDVIEVGWNSKPGGPEKYIADGKIIRLNEYIEEYAPNFSKLLTENPEYKKMVTTNDGSIFAFPFLRGDDFLLTFKGLVIRKDWLDNLNMDIPETVDEWYAVLKAFKENDPNNNGVADEVPLFIIWTDPGFMEAWGITKDFYQVDGQVKYSLIEPEFKQYITTLKQWYDEGLLDPDFVIMDYKLKEEKLFNDRLGAYYSYTIKENEVMRDRNSRFEIAAAPNPVLIKGETPIIGHQEPAYTGYGAAISTSAKNIPGIVKWLDFNYGEQGHLLFNFGVEGESYTMVNDYPKFNEIIWLDPNAIGRYALSPSYGPFVQDKRWMEQKVDQAKNGRQSLETWMIADNKRHLPPLSPSEKEIHEYASIISDVKTYSSEMVDKFIIGVESMDKFDQFVQRLKDMGIERAIQIQQNALDRYNQR